MPRKPVDIRSNSCCVAAIVALFSICLLVPEAADAQYSNRPHMAAGEEPVLRALDPEVCAELLARYPEAPDYSAGGSEIGPPADLPGGTGWRPEGLQGWVVLPAAPGGHGGPGGQGPGGHRPPGNTGEIGAGMIFSPEPVPEGPALSLAEALAACRAFVEEPVPQK